MGFFFFFLSSIKSDEHVLRKKVLGCSHIKRQAVSVLYVTRDNINNISKDVSYNLEVVKVESSPEKQYYNLLFCHLLLDLDQHMLFLLILGRRMLPVVEFIVHRYSFVNLVVLKVCEAWRRREREHIRNRSLWIFRCSCQWLWQLQECLRTAGNICAFLRWESPRLVLPRTVWWR